MKRSGALLLGGVPAWVDDGVQGELRFHSDGIVDGVIAREYGKYGADNQFGMPTRSLPITITLAPENTACFAVTIVDFDAIPAVGFCWVHWLVCNFTGRELPENASVERRSTLTQGVNSWSAPLLGANALAPEIAAAYGGMAPPDRPHHYDITLYACSEKLNLQNGFSWNHFLNALDGRLLAATTLRAVYHN